MNDLTTSSPAFSKLEEITTRYQVNLNKPFFPLNTLRLVYLILAETVGTKNREIIDKRAQRIVSVIPKVQALLDARSAAKLHNPGQSFSDELAQINEQVQDILQIVPGPLAKNNLEATLSYVFPLQDTILMSLYSDVSKQKSFDIQDIFTIFHVRSMDSIIYAGLVSAILSMDVNEQDLPAQLYPTLNYKLSALYQLNDLVDTIVYARQDLESQNFSPFQIIRKATNSIEEAKQIITAIANTFEQRIDAFQLEPETEQLIREFTHQLVRVISNSQQQGN